MRILMLTPYLPYPPSSGGQVRSYNLLKHLGKKHKIVLVALIKNDAEKQYVKNLEKYCEKIYVCRRSESPWTVKNIVKSIFGRYPFLVVRNFSQDAKDTISQLLSTTHFDLIHAETFYIMPHIPSTKTPILLVEQTIEYKVYQHFVNNLAAVIRPFFYFDIVKLKHWEKTYWKKADLVGVVSEDDQNKIHAVIPELKIEIIPNAAGEDLNKLYQPKKIIKKPIFLYQGNFYWLQNIEAAKVLAMEIFPRIKEHIPEALCYIAGQKATAKINGLERYGVKVIDINPADTEAVQKVYSEASVFLAPIKGPGGTRLKILGAMAAGLPVISSPTGVSGLDIANRQDVLIAKNNSDFVRLSLEILKDKKLYQTIRENAKQMVEEKYNWTTVSSKLEQIYLKLTQLK